MRYWQVLFSLSFLLFAIGCSDSNNSSCKDDSECKTWQFCNTSSGNCDLREGYCERHPDCADKGAQIYCDTLEHQCVECMQDYHCEMGASCGANNYCVREKEVTCSADVECLGVTVKGECYIPPGYASGFCVDCKKDTDCGEGYLCNSNYKCEVKTPCDSDEACEDMPGMNQCFMLNGTSSGYCVSCLTGADCPNGKQCNENHQCEIVTNPKQCMNNADCADDYLGRTTCHILPGKVIGQCVQCAGDSDCPIGQDCTLNGLCENGNPGIIKCTEDTTPDADDRIDAECTPYTPYQFCFVKDGATDGICAECLENSDCEGNQRCNENNRCDGDNNDETGCSNSMECLDNKHCQVSADGTGTCVECLNNSQCPPNQVCAGTNKCTDNNGTCQHHGDCSYGLYCDIYFGGNGLCVQCLEDAHCPEGKTCEMLSCVDGETDPTECGTDNDCTGTQKYCYQEGNQQAICVECIKDEHCSGGLVCNPVQNCVDPSDETACKTNNDCLVGVCLKKEGSETGVCVSCIKDADCPTGQICHDDHYCVHHDPVPECNSKNDCLTGECYLENSGTSGICVECLSDNDCPGEQLCNQYQKCTDSNEPPICDTENNCTDPANCYTPEGNTTGFCLPCLSDSECKEGEVCTEEFECKVQNPIDTCNGANPCDKGKCYVADGQPVGSDGICVECFDDADCGKNAICTAALECQNIQPQECQNDSECSLDRCLIPDGIDCSENTALCQCVECLTTEDCKDGKTCNSNHKCEVPNDPNTCTTTTNCNADATCYIPKDGGDGVCIECFKNSDCDKGEVCTLDFECIPGSDDGYCANDFDCIDQEYERHCYVPEDKSTGQCVICDEDAHCPQGSSCVDFQCTVDGVDDQFEKCTKTSDCSIGECYIQVGESEGICVVCDEDDDCKTGQVCNDSHTCENNTTPTECTLDSDCESNVCLKDKDATKGICVECTPENSTNCKPEESCNTNHKCDNPNEPPVCSLSKPCSDDKICFIPEGELNGSCLDCLTNANCEGDETCNDRTCNGGGTPCTSNADCTPGTCYMEAGTTTGTCIDCTGQENCPTESNCTSTSQCPEGLECIVAGDETTGTCIECMQDSDCKNGQTCSDQVCVNICTTKTDCSGTSDCFIQVGNDTGVCIDCTGEINCPGTGTCTDNESCGTEKICVIPEGATEGSCLTCLTDEHCPVDSICVDQECKAPCINGGEACTTGECYHEVGTTSGSCIDCDDQEHCPNNGCSDNTECPAGSICVIADGATSGTCIECLENTDCSYGELCTNNQCGNGTPECEKDADCGVGYCYKPEGKIPGVCIECVQDSDCLTGQVCNAQHVCENQTDPTDCSQDASICNAQQHCFKPTWSATKICVDCIDQYAKNGCKDQEICNEETNQCIDPNDTPNECLDITTTETTITNPCPDGGTCYQHETEPDYCFECISNSDCPVGEICDSNLECNITDNNCDSNSDCSPGVCDPETNQCTECNSTQDCPEGTTCNENGRCESNENGSECTVATEEDDCGEGRHCYIGIVETSGKKLQPILDGDTPLNQQGIGVCVDCIVDQDCNSFQKCNEFTCEGSCESDEQCPEGEICDPETGQCDSDDPCSDIACPDNASCEMIDGEGARCDCDEGHEFFDGECVEINLACEDDMTHSMTGLEANSLDIDESHSLCGYKKGYISVTNPTGDDPERLYVSVSNIRDESELNVSPDGLMLTVTDPNDNVVATTFTDSNIPCGSGDSCATGSYCNTRGLACTSPNDCLFNKCVNERCTRSGSTCKDQNDCKENYCSGGSCHLTNHACTAQDIDCADNICHRDEDDDWFEGKCTQTGEACIWGMFCKPNLCFAGQCSVSNTTCSPTDSCPSTSRICNQGVCAAPSTGLRCKDLTDCQNNDEGYKRCETNINSINYLSCVPEGQTGTLYEENKKVCLPENLSVSYWVGDNKGQDYRIEVINLGQEKVGFDLTVSGSCKEDYECGGRPMQCLTDSDGSNGKCVEYCETHADCGNDKMICNFENHTCVYECAAPGVDQSDSPINASHVTLPHRTTCAEIEPRDEEDVTDIDWFSFDLAEGDDLMMALDYGFDPRAIVYKEDKYVTNTNFANFIEVQLFFENPGTIFNDPVEPRNTLGTGGECRVEQDDDGNSTDTNLAVCPAGTICSATYTREKTGICVRNRLISNLGMWNAPENTKKMHYKIKRTGTYYIKLSRIKPRSEITTPYTLNISSGCTQNTDCSEGYNCYGGSCELHCVRHEQCHTGRGEYCGSDHKCKRVVCKLDKHCNGISNSIKSADRFYCSLKDPVPTCKVKLPNNDNGCVNHSDNNNYESVAQPFRKSSVSYPLAGSVDPDDVMAKFELQKSSTGYAGTSCNSDQDWLYLELENKSYYLGESNCNEGGSESHHWFDWSWGWGDFFYHTTTRVECGERYNDKCADPCGKTGAESYYECKQNGQTATSGGAPIGLYRCKTKAISEFKSSENAANTGFTRENCSANSDLGTFECSSDSNCRAKIGSCLDNTDCANVGPYKYCDSDTRRLTLKESVELQIQKDFERRQVMDTIRPEPVLKSHQDEASGGAGEVCGSVTCKQWETCVTEGETQSCQMLEGQCQSNSNCTEDDHVCDIGNTYTCNTWCYFNAGTCNEWEECSNEEKRCNLKEDRCYSSDSNCRWNTEEILCNTDTHNCFDPCSSINCDGHRFCNRKHIDPETTGGDREALCDLEVNRCDHDCNVRGSSSVGTKSGAGCAQNELCDEGNHTCKAAGSCVECTQDSHCTLYVRSKVYHRCQDNRCVECKVHSDCGEGYKCVTPTTSPSSMGSGYNRADVKVFRGCDSNGNNCKNDYTCLRQYPPIYSMMVTSSNDILFDIRGKNEEVSGSQTTFSLGAPYNVLAYAYSQEDSDYALAKATMIHPGKYYVHVMHEGLDFYQKSGQCRECYQNSHCATGYRCEAGSCVKYGSPNASCLNNGTCKALCNIDIDCNQFNSGSSKFICMNMPIGAGDDDDNGNYARGEVECSSVTDCYEYEVCTDGFCRPKDNSCADDNDCRDIFKPKCNMNTHSCQEAGVCAPACTEVDEHSGCGNNRYCVSRKYKYQLGSDLYKTDDNEDNGCHPIEQDGHKYLFCGVDDSGNRLNNWTRSWDQARENCRKWGYTLVTINDKNEDNWVYAKTGDHDTWYGFNDKAKEGTWTWESGEPVTYKNWDSGEPNDARGEDCMLSWTGKQQWNDLGCENKMPYVCEYPLEDDSLGGCVDCGYDIFECNYGKTCSPYSNSCIEDKAITLANQENSPLRPGQSGYFPCAVDDDCRTSNGENPLSSNKYCYHALSKENVNYNLQVQVLRTYNHPLFTANLEQNWWGWWRTWQSGAYRFLADVQSMKCDPPENNQNDSENTKDSYRGWVNSKCTEGTSPRRSECSQYNACKSSVEDHTGQYGDYCDTISDCDKDAVNYDGCVNSFHCTKSCQTKAECDGGWCDGRNEISPGNCHKDCNSFPERDEYGKHIYCNSIFQGYESDCDTDNGRCQVICEYDSHCMALYGRFSRCLDRPKGRECNTNEDCVPSGINQPSGCFQKIINGTEYLFCTEKRTWQAAQEKCKSYGSEFSLVTINSGSENTAVFNAATDNTEGIGSSFWIGLNDINKENKFVWDSNDDNDYTHYHSGEPNNASNEDCIHMWKSGTWNDNQCNTRYPFVCEYNVHPVCDLDPDTQTHRCFKPGKCDTDVDYPAVTE